jgi:hypothetical protein
MIERLNAANALYVTRELRAVDVLGAAAQQLSPEEMWLSRWALVGQSSGHEWCVCSACGELRLMKPPTPSGPRERCVMTYDCEGEMQRIVKRPLTTKKVKRNLRESNE